MIANSNRSRPTLEPPPVIEAQELDLLNSRKALKPVLLPNEEGNPQDHANLSPRKRFLQQARSSKINRVSGSRESLGTKLNKKLSLKKNSDKLFQKKPVKKEETVSVMRQKYEQEHHHQQQGIQERGDVKTVLFHHKYAKITCFENTRASNANGSSSPPTSTSFEFRFSSSDRILGHGPLEIYSMHDNSVNYLQCGTVIYPILPKLKILRIGMNKFILPLSNPERYWLISVRSNSDTRLEKLAICLNDICSYRDLYVSLNYDDDDYDSEEENVVSPVPSPQLEALPQQEQEQEQDVPSLMRDFSTTSITTEIACFNMTRTRSAQSSLDLELDQFGETLTEFPAASGRKTRSARSRSSSILTDLASSSFQHVHDVRHKYSNNTNITDFGMGSSLHQKPSFDGTLKSRNSLYRVEPSWMSVDDDGDKEEEDSRRELVVDRDSKSFTDSVLFQNLHRLKTQETLTRLSAVEVAGVVKDEQQQQVQSRSSIVGRLFGW